MISRAKTIRNTGKIFTMPEASLCVEGINARCMVLFKGLSSTKIMEGKIVTQPITPKITPFAMTIPRSLPRVKVMKHSAIKPATVVMELPTTEARVSLIASAMASLLSETCALCSP